MNFETYQKYLTWTSFQPANSNQPLPSTESGFNMSYENLFKKNFKIYCDFCPKVYLSKKRFENHQKLCKGFTPEAAAEIIICNLCRKLFKTQIGHKNHMFKFHEIDKNGRDEEKSLKRTIEDENDGKSPKKFRSSESSLDSIDILEDKEEEEVPTRKRKSIFHSIELLAQSDDPNSRIS